MQKYIGTTIILAVAMTLSEYNEKREWNIPNNVDPDQKGYFVEYENGHQSWSPKETFEASYRKADGLPFGIAIELAKKGELITRAGWNGKGMFVFIRKGDTFSVSFLIEKIKTFPKSVKQYYNDLFSHTVKEEKDGESPDEVMVTSTPGFIMKAADGTLVNGWLASQTDMLAEDWQVFKG